MTAPSIAFDAQVGDPAVGDPLPYGLLSVEQLTEGIAAGCVDAVVLVTPDNSGRCLSERVPAVRFLRNLDNPTAYCMPLLLWGVDIEQVPRASLDDIAGMGAGVPDVKVVPDLTTIRRLPWLPRSPIVICDPADDNGTPVPYMPRQILKVQVARLAALGVTVQAATELEFYLFDETYEEAWHSRYASMTPSSRYHAAYDAVAAIKSEPFIGEIIRQFDLAGIEIEGYANEYGHGQQEINLKHTGVLEMADRHFLYKFGVKSIATQMGVSATFMAKWAIDDDGSSCHIHTSLWDETGAVPLGNDPRFDGFVAGIAARAAEAVYMYAPTMNSYRRFQANSFAPTVIAVGENNRTCSLRLVDSGPTRRLENRIPGADVNPYVALAAMAASGVGGIEAGLEMPRFEQGDMYGRTDVPTLPTSLAAALDLFEHSDSLRAGLGAEVHRHLVTIGREEELAFLTETVTDWERRRLFERV